MDVQCVLQPRVMYLVDLMYDLLLLLTEGALTGTSSEADGYLSVFFKSCMWHLVTF